MAETIEEMVRRLLSKAPLWKTRRASSGDDLTGLEYLDEDTFLTGACSDFASHLEQYSSVCNFVVGPDLPLSANMGAGDVLEMCSTISCRFVPAQSGSATLSLQL